MKTSKRHKAWKNLMISGINEALKLKLIGLKEGENYFFADQMAGNTYTYKFTLDGGHPAMGRLSDIGFGELHFHLIVYPSHPYFYPFNVGAEAEGWLERRTGPYLMALPPHSKLLFSCKKMIQPQLERIVVTPDGYAPAGKFKM